MRLITTKEETLIAIDILAETYANAPNIKWMFNQNRRNLRYFFQILLEDAMAKNGAYITPNNSGILFFYELRQKNFSLKSICRKAHLAFSVIGLKRTIQIIKLNKLKERYRPQNGYYGSILAVKQNDFRWNTNFELKQDFNHILKQLNQPAYFETTNPRIYLLYKTLGFSVYHEMDHPYADLTIYFMKIDPLQTELTSRSEKSIKQSS